MNKKLCWNFDNTYIHLPDLLYVNQNPVPVASPRMVMFNQRLSDSLNLNTEALQEKDGISVLAGNTLPEKSQPIAMAYAGHQFGHFTILGDGRAILIGEHITKDKKRFDIQLKGTGKTPFSRGGDGRAALGPMLREYIMSEAMHALEIPTNRSLAVVSTGQDVFRESPMPGAVLVRVAASHIRVGTFEYLMRKGSVQDIKALTDYTIKRHYPELETVENPYLEFLNKVMDRQAFLMAKWMKSGFIHGVMNTDNMALSGETIDYGPCAFMDVYDPATVFSSIDHHGRYAFGNQPDIAQWNLARLAETLLPLIDPDQKNAIELASNAVKYFPEIFRKYWLDEMRGKLGLFTREEQDISLINELFNCMHENRVDYTNTFRDLALDQLPESQFFLNPDFSKWHSLWQKRLFRQSESIETARQLMNRHNPAVI
ncbi:MAG: YdiU family protein, partial [Desulfonatronovibrio sp.]